MLRDLSSQDVNTTRISDVEIGYRLAPVVGYDARRMVERHKVEVLQAIQRVLESGSLILGPEVAAFENEFAQYVGCQHAVGMASGTDALIVAMKAIGIGPGDSVITVANGPVPTAAAIRAVGATPCFVDIDPDTLQMDVVQLRSAICQRTKCVILVHLYGYATDISEILNVCKQQELFLIEDCAQAHGTTFDGRHVGGFGDIGCFSFYPTKNLGALGDAGMCVTNNPIWEQKLREIAQYGFRGGSRIAICDGVNSRLDAMQAAILRALLPHLSRKLERKREIANHYTEHLSNTPIKLTSVLPLVQPSWHQFVVRCRQRDKMLEFLRQRSVQASVHYEWPVHTMPAFARTSETKSRMKETQMACKQVLSLPIQPELQSHEVSRVTHAIQDALQKGID